MKNATATPARTYPLRHLSIRVPWHDNGWTGTVCNDPAGNTSCLVLKRIGETRDDITECNNHGRSLKVIPEKEWPCCTSERGHFMAPFDFTRGKSHPYAESSQLHKHFLETPLRQPAYATDAVPFNWMWKENLEYYRDFYRIDADPAREPDLGFNTVWAQHRDNHAALLDCFFGHIQEEESLCFFYAKRTPLSEDQRRVIIGVGKVRHKGDQKEYLYSVKEKDAPLRSLLWERMIQHSIRPKGEEGKDGFEGGFLLPYQQALAYAAEHPEFDPASVVAFAPDDRRDEFSYVTEHVTHDGAIGALLSCAGALREAAKHLKGPWERYQKWIDTELGKLWKMRGPCPGLGAALTAFGIELGVFVAYELGKHIGENEDPWPVVDQMFQNPKKYLSPDAARQVGTEHQTLWKSLPKERRALLAVISRFEVTPEQAASLYVTEERDKVGIQVSDAEILANPYRLYEVTRTTATPISFATVDRGVFPDASVRDKHPLPKPSRVDTGTDPRRVRALVVQTLEAAASDGDTLQPRDDVITTIREMELRPGCPITGDLMTVAEGQFQPEVRGVVMAHDKPAFQLNRLAEAGSLIKLAVEKRIAGKPHQVQADWKALLADKKALGPVKEGDTRDASARKEKAEALAKLAEARFSVLIGPAGTGKTTLLTVLCSHKAIADGGVLLLAPTGKARVRMEQAAQQRDLKLTGQTIAQYLYGSGRYDPQTGIYRTLGPNAPKGSGKADKSSVPDTVIIDEASMLTEEMLAAVLEAVAGAKRIILVGDHRQLPPIGAGRPFADAVRRLQPLNVDAIFPRVGNGYAELTIRMRGNAGATAPDVRLASWFTGADPGPGEDDTFSGLSAFGKDDRLQVIPWRTADECHELLNRVLQTELSLSGPDDVIGFGKKLGGSEFNGYCYFHMTGDDKGVGNAAEAWQIISPIKGMPFGVVGLNRYIHKTFRAQAVQLAQNRFRKTPKPLGPEEIVYGDKVINVSNHRRFDVYPKEGAAQYLANGEIGIAVGQYKGKQAAYKGLPWKLEVEFTSQPRFKYGFDERDFGEEGSPTLELAYALTVHRAQGSEFGTVIFILPNPCRLLSRELLYTALTRQKNRVVILFQGNPADLRLYADARYSETARRLTNLFFAPDPVWVGDRRYDDKLIHRTARGELVRSKSEVIIANELHRLDVEYHYEKELKFGTDAPRYPDFTIDDPASGLTVYWEHCGMLGDPGYLSRWEGKKAWYRANGILPMEEGGGPNGTLVVTDDNPKTGFDSTKIAEIVSKLTGG
ncbi:MAG: AAA family ATPase [Gemmataceae bacterium]